MYVTHKGKSWDSARQIRMSHIRGSCEQRWVGMYVTHKEQLWNSAGQICMSHTRVSAR